MGPYKTPSETPIKGLYLEILCFLQSTPPPIRCIVCYTRTSLVNLDAIFLCEHCHQGGGDTSALKAHCKQRLIEEALHKEGSLDVV